MNIAIELQFAILILAIHDIKSDLHAGQISVFVSGVLPSSPFATKSAICKQKRKVQLSFSGLTSNFLFLYANRIVQSFDLCNIVAIDMDLPDDFAEEQALEWESHPGFSRSEARTVPEPPLASPDAIETAGPVVVLQNKPIYDEKGATVERRSIHQTFPGSWSGKVPAFDLIKGDEVWTYRHAWGQV